jgi:hypothetical protein
MLRQDNSEEAENDLRVRHESINRHKLRDLVRGGLLSSRECDLNLEKHNDVKHSAGKIHDEQRGM